jgi:hypothetical protein
MGKANNNSDIGRTWSDVLEDLEALEHFDDYGAALENGHSQPRLVLRLVQGDEMSPNEEVLYSMDGGAHEDDRLLASAFWDELHLLLWKHVKIRERQLRRELTTMASRVNLFRHDAFSQ